jgi:hypothetical protein
MVRASEEPNSVAFNSGTVIDSDIDSYADLISLCVST